MITCPKCQHNEPSGALYCSECGEPLAFTDKLPDQSESKNEEFFTTAGRKTVGSNQTQVLNPEAQVSLLLIDGNQSIPLVGRQEFTIGRVTEGQPILPDVDLTEFDAYAHGVSRLHATIKIVAGIMFVLDLGSSNGTRINGKKILPNIEYPIKPGDVLVLGRLQMKIVVDE